ncbi:MAG: flavodoxin [Blautia sp.]|nr:flavodoxin [Blautia sp.]
MKKVLVTCFSATGVTKGVAQALAEAEGGDFFEILPETPYTSADLDWNNKTSRSTVEMQDPNCRPAITGAVENMDQYEVIFLGFPLWWGREPSIVDTFLEAYDFSGKVIVPFCTSGGSGIGFTGDRIARIAKGNPTVVNGNRLGGTTSMADLKTWAEGLDVL